MTFPKYLCAKEVAAIIGIDHKTVYKLAVKGEIPGHIKFGSLHRFDAEELYKGLKDKVTLKKTASKRPRGYNDNRHNL
jgi:excisionase family DNA binding protein